MKFLLDQDVYASTARFLASLGHEVVPVAQVGLSQADDEELLRLAQEQGRIFVTRDRDFGASLCESVGVRSALSADVAFYTGLGASRTRKSLGRLFRGRDTESLCGH